MKTYEGFVSMLKANEVFVFGSNLIGFHGAGAAGFASFGVSGNHWRDRDYASKPDGWKGRWNVKGMSVGYQEGTEGASYALPTMTAPGKPAKLNHIRRNIKQLYRYAEDNPDKNFLIAYTIKGYNINGYSNLQMAQQFAANPIPENIVFEKGFGNLIQTVLNEEV